MNSISKFLHSPVGIFFAGSLIGLIFFIAFYGLSIVNPTYTDWIFQSITHDTAQNFIGWEFFRADSTGGIINGLAYPVGLPVTFMDTIPLLAFPLNWMSDILPENFQYFGIWAMSCYVLVGGVSAILVRKIWQKIFVGKYGSRSLWQIVFVMAGSLIFVSTPMLIARSLYHPALAAHWLILLGILLVWDARKIKRSQSFIALWSGLLTVAVLIHPYFVPMLGAMLLIAALRRSTDFKWKSVLSMLASVTIPLVIMGTFFATIGGFGLGSGAEIRDLSEKGFNLLSFINPSGYSALLPGFPNVSSSPETLMWLGLGVLMMTIMVSIGFCGKYKKSWRMLTERFRANKLRNGLILLVAVGLLIFSIGVSVDLGPIRLFTYSVPDKIYEIWSAFRAAAREAWVFYYVTILVLIYLFSKLLVKYRQASMAILSCSLLAISLVQASDVWFSEKATARREGFVAVQDVSKREFVAPDITDLVTTQKHLVMLDSGFRGDQSGTYQIAQAALENDLTLNIGFFARIPEPIWDQQSDWRSKVSNLRLSNDDLNDYIFATSDKGLAQKAAANYRIEQRGGFWFIAKI